MEIQKIFSEIDTDERIYSVLLNEDELALFSEIQKEFNSKDQKARRAKWETENQSRPSQKEIDYQLKDPRSKVEKKLDQELGIKDNPRYNKTQKEAIDAAKKKNFRSDLMFKNITADKLEGDQTIRQEYRKKRAQILKRRKQTEEYFKKLNEERVENEANAAAQESAQKAATIKNQVNKNGSGMLKKGMEWANRNKVGLGIAAGTTALAGGGAYLYNKAKKKNQNKDNN